MLPKISRDWQSVWLVSVAGVLLVSLALAGTTGKIAGTVTDAKSGEPLPGVNLVIAGTSLGAATDASGRYFMISIPPGEYSLRVTMMGYQTTEIKKVKISLDQTTRIDIRLTEAVLDLGQSVEIVAERPVIQKDLTTSVEVVNLQELKQSVATSVSEAVNLQTGVFFDPMPVEGNLSGLGRGEPRYSIRGGEQDQVVWFIDGARSNTMSENKADAGGSFTQINQDAVQEIQVITGGFNAEYGQAQSGIVNVITKDGDEQYRFSVDYQYGPAHQRHFGNYLYDRTKSIEFIRHTLADGTLDPLWWTSQRQKQIYDYRAFDDHDLRLSFGGPLPGRFLPLLGDEIKKMTFFLTLRYAEQAYELPRPRDTRQLTNINLSGNYTIKPGMSLKYGALWNHDAHATNAEEYFPFMAKYYRGYGSLLDNYTYQSRLALTHAVSANLFYELKLNSHTFKQDEVPSPYRVLGESRNPDVWGWHRYDGFEDEPFLSYQFAPLSHNLTNDLSLTGSLSWQANTGNFIKSGFEFHYHTFKEDSWVLPSDSDDLKNWRLRGLNETYHPLQFAAYLQDKMEFESMILNMGVRYDFYHGNRDWFTTDSYVLNPSLDENYRSAKDPDKNGIDSLGHKKWAFENVLAKDRERVQPFHSFNPRLGISFPITEQTVFHFSYGHFYQIPAINTQYEFSYFRPVSVIKGAPSTDSDPERVISLTLEPLKPEKTIQFELGIKHHFENIAVLNVTGFYKDIFDQVERPEFLDRRIYGIDPYTGNESQVFYSSRYNGDYADARGVEIGLKSLFSNYLVLDLNYSFSKSTHGKATPWQIHIGADGEVTYKWYTDPTDRLPLEQSFSRPHILRLNIFMQYPNDWRIPVIYPVLGNTDLSLLYRYSSGQTFTYLDADDPPDLLDNHRYPARQTWDLKFSKYMTLGQHTFSLYTKVTNLFNQKNIQAFGNAWDDVALQKFLKTGEPTSDYPQGKDADGNDIRYDISYSIYYAPRSIWLGLRYNFR